MLFINSEVLVMKKFCLPPLAALLALLLLGCAANPAQTEASDAAHSN